MSDFENPLRPEQGTGDTMTNVDLQLAHQAAARNHEVNQKIAAFRHAALILEANLPTGEVQRRVVKQIAATLRHDAAILGTQL